jgi:hypothetical protein
MENMEFQLELNGNEGFVVKENKLNQIRFIKTYFTIPSGMIKEEAIVKRELIYEVPHPLISYEVPNRKIYKQVRI